MTKRKQKGMLTTQEALRFLDRKITTLRHHTYVSGKLTPLRNEQNDLLYPVYQLQQLKDELEEKLNPDEYFLIGASEYLGITRHTLMKHYTKGYIQPVRRVKGKLVFRRDHLDTLREKHVRSSW